MKSSEANRLRRETLYVCLQGLFSWTREAYAELIDLELLMERRDAEELLRRARSASEDVARLIQGAHGPAGGPLPTDDPEVPAPSEHPT